MRTTPSLLPFFAVGVTACVALAVLVGLSWHANDPGAMLARPAPPWAMPDAASPPLGAGGQTVQALRDADGLFYVTAEVNGHPVRFVVDTGASMMVLSGPDAASAGVVPNAQRTTITTADGSATMGQAVVARMDLVGRQLHDIPTTIASNGRVSLIGENILGRLQSISITGNRMELR